MILLISLKPLTSTSALPILMSDRASSFAAFKLSFLYFYHKCQIKSYLLQIIGHIVLCFLAFVMPRNLEIALIRKGTDHTVEK
ncbi:hypothetical protein NEOC65_000743 [Neochlamydia sp. AcF65]|nr:hypothetical protein [Neochlamydia sp. AcF65]